MSLYLAVGQQTYGTPVLLHIHEKIVIQKGWIARW